MRGKHKKPKARKMTESLIDKQRELLILNKPEVTEEKILAAITEIKTKLIYLKLNAAPSTDLDKITIEYKEFDGIKKRIELLGDRVTNIAKIFIYLIEHYKLNIEVNVFNVALMRMGEMYKRQFAYTTHH